MCTTTEYKSLTRAHVQELGYRVVANFGDQFSDLLGGHAEQGGQAAEPDLLPPLREGHPWICSTTHGA